MITVTWSYQLSTVPDIPDLRPVMLLKPHRVNSFVLEMCVCVCVSHVLSCPMNNNVHKHLM